MKLTLTNAYPYPYPDGLSEEEQEAITHDSCNHDLVIEGVYSFQWLHTVTVEFRYMDHYYAMMDKLGWKEWSFRVLEAPTSAGDGYDHPAIIVKDKAYCGFILSR